MKNYIEEIKQSLREKKGVSDVETLEYRELPKGGKECYTNSMAIGSVSLITDRYMTIKEADELVNEFINISLP